MNDISDDFYEAFHDHSGGCYRECSCGRIHFCSTAGFDFEDGELERYLQKSEKDPDKYIDHGDCSVGYIDVGELVVYGCPCGISKKYEDWIWSRRTSIIEYLQKRIKGNFDKAKDELALVENITTEAGK